jgi:hypothetical protein
VFIAALLPALGHTSVYLNGHYIVSDRRCDQSELYFFGDVYLTVSPFTAWALYPTNSDEIKYTQQALVYTSIVKFNLNLVAERDFSKLLGKSRGGVGGWW